MTQKADPQAFQAITSLSDADAVAAATAPAARTKQVTFTPPPFGTARFTFYQADHHGVTPGAWRVQVTGPQGINADLVVADVLGADLDGALAKLFLAAVGA